jgi:hypothetical protein
MQGSYQILELFNMFIKCINGLLKAIHLQVATRKSQTTKWACIHSILQLSYQNTQGQNSFNLYKNAWSEFFFEI